MKRAGLRTCPGIFSVLLRRFSSDYATSRNISLDATLAHHLQQCSYHLRLFRSWLISGQDDLECLYGTARCSCLSPVLLDSVLLSVPLLMEEPKG
uniref:Uncharacterized protein n=1 Tax=Meleagris gallopavo TaxID=9103 RepID=A0A803XRY7_MELGA